jgi:hypothetical protein
MVRRSRSVVTSRSAARNGWMVTSTDALGNEVLAEDFLVGVEEADLAQAVLSRPML